MDSAPPTHCRAPSVEATRHDLSATEKPRAPISRSVVDREVDPMLVETIARSDPQRAAELILRQARTAGARDLSATSQTAGCVIRTSGGVAARALCPPPHNPRVAGPAGRGGGRGAPRRAPRPYADCRGFIQPPGPTAARDTFVTNAQRCHAPLSLDAHRAREAQRIVERGARMTVAR